MFAACHHATLPRAQYRAARGNEQSRTPRSGATIRRHTERIADDGRQESGSAGVP
jgi:hypothetical protein